jgi:putative endonuclease
MFKKLHPSHLIKGKQSEQQACEYLIKQGLTVIEKNFQSRCGELDLIMQDNGVVVIVEVRYRKSNHFGGALESITSKKQARIMATTQYFMMINKVDKPIRFDVVAMTGDKSIHWIKDAFQG